MLRIFGRSMRIRHVSAGDCGGCKDEFNAMSNIVFDLSRFASAWWHHRDTPTCCW